MSWVVWLANQRASSGTTVYGAGTEMDLGAVATMDQVFAWKAEGKLNYVAPYPRGVYVAAKTATTAQIAFVMDEPNSALLVQSGLTTSFGTNTTPTPSSGVGNIVANLTGLTTGTLYYYRVVVTVVGGGKSTYTPTATFTTL